MNFKQFLLEEDLAKINTEDLKPIIQRDCSKYLSEIKGKVLYRGLKLLNDKDGNVPSVAKITAKTNRKPRNSPIEFHNGFNKAFEELHDVKDIRSRATFCTGDQSDAGTYGIVYAIFPIGNYTYWWSQEVIDSYIDFEDMFDMALTVNNLEDFVDRSEYKNKDLDNAISSRREVMLLCDSYYAVNTEGRIDHYDLIG